MITIVAFIAIFMMIGYALHSTSSARPTLDI